MNDAEVMGRTLAQMGLLCAGFAVEAKRLRDAGLSTVFDIDAETGVQRLREVLERMEWVRLRPLVPIEPSPEAIKAAAVASGFATDDDPPDAILTLATAKMLRAAYAVERVSRAPDQETPK